MTTINQIRKRDGNIVSFDVAKIIDAAAAALKAAGTPNQEVAEHLSVDVVQELLDKGYDQKEQIPTVELVQDLLENAFVKRGLTHAAKAFIIYREEHKKAREGKHVTVDVKDLVEGYLGQEDWRVNENSNSGYSYASLLNHASGAVIANYTLSNVYPTEIAQAHTEGDIHLHDLSCGIVGYCAGWSLRELLEMGFKGRNGRSSANPAKHFDTALLQAVNFLCTLQTEWAGAQAFSSFDTFMAPFIRHDRLTYEQVKQCMQQFIFGLNIASRWGQCVPETTKCLKADGSWVNYEGLSIGDEIIVFDEKTGSLKIDRITQLTVKPYSGKLHHYSNRHGFQFRVTPDHRVIYKKGNNTLRITESSNLLSGKSPVDIPILGDYESEDYAIEDSILQFITFILCDGCIQRDATKKSVIRFYKAKSRWGQEEFEALCAMLGITYSISEDMGGFETSVACYTLHSSPIVDTIIELLDNTKSVVPAWFSKLSKRQAYLVIDTWSKLDGNREKFRLQCDNESIQDALASLIIKAGYGCRKYSRIIGINKTPTLYVSVYTRRFKSCTISEEDYSGVVWCPTTNTGTFVARSEEGYVFFTGNCPFTNLTFDWVPPDDLKAHPVILGGKLMETETYGDFQEEMDMVNKAFLEVMAAGDSDGRIFTFPIPTYNITKDFNWDSENAKLLFEVTGKYGLPYFQNFVNSELSPGDVRSFCCRLQLDMKELRNKTGGLFGAGEKTGSVGVCTINLPRIGYLSKSEDEYFERLDKLMDVAKESLEIKRALVQKNLDNDLMPYTKVYLGHLKQHFSTIGLIGMNESCLNLLGCSVCDPEGLEFSIKVLRHMKERIKKYQEETGHVYNLEGVPGEGTSFRLAKIDKKKFPEIICAGDKNPYYTNSTQLPVGYTTDLFEALDLQEPLQKEYTGGTVFHAFIGERIDDAQLVAELVKRIATNYKIPYFTLTPSFSICPVHGYIPGEHHTCPCSR